MLQWVIETTGSVHMRMQLQHNKNSYSALEPCTTQNFTEAYFTHAKKPVLREIPVLFNVQVLFWTVARDTGRHLCQLLSIFLCISFHMCETT